MSFLKGAASLVFAGFFIGVGIYLSKKACTAVETAILVHSTKMQDAALGKPSQAIRDQAPAA